MTDQGVVVLGIPIPSSSPPFLSIVAVHVVAGLICTVAGIVAMLTPKHAGRHPSAGTVYYWSLVVVFLTMAVLSIVGWPHNAHLFVLGILSFDAGVVGRRARRRLWCRWLPVHIAEMAVSSSSSSGTDEQDSVFSPYTTMETAHFCSLTLTHVAGGGARQTPADTGT